MQILVPHYKNEELQNKQIKGSQMRHSNGGYNITTC